jgi:predicted 3-demethylubiquinone-9 3-methyltransferase (glyoxalase superfamily)
MSIRQKITPHLWFDNNAEEAANLYTSIFPNSKITAIARYPEGSPGPAGTVMTVAFTLDGQDFVGINGGPIFKFSEAVSFLVDCETQAEVDTLWEKLLAGGGAEQQCGWLKDRFGLSWQISSMKLVKMMTDPNPARPKRVMDAMLKMKKIDIARLEQAYAG